MERLAKLVFFIGLLLYFVIAVVVRTPAEWGAWAALKAVPGLTLSGVSGSLWSGRAASAQVNINGQPLDLGSLQWQLNGWALFLLKACLNVESENARGYVCHGVNGTTIAEKLLVDQLPAKLLDSVIGVQLGGIGSATFQRAVIGRDGSVKDLEGSVSWQRGAINVGTGWFALGSFAADLTDNEQGGIRANIHDLEGEFVVQLQGEYTPGGQPRVNGTVTPKENAPQPLKDALSVFAETLDDGSFKVSWPIGGG